MLEFFMVAFIIAIIVGIITVVRHCKNTAYQEED